MIVDAHTHISNRRGGSSKLTPEDLLESLKGAGISAAILLANELPTNDPSEGGISNEQAVEIGRKFSQLKPVARVSIESVDEDLQKIGEWFSRGEIYGVKMYPGYEDYNPADERLAPVYSLCQRLSKTVIFHTGVLLMGSRGVLKQTHPLNIDEVANKFPELKIVMAHAGNPWILDAAAVVAKNPNVYVDISGYFTEWQSITGDEAKDFLSKFTEFGLFVGGFKKVLFGTDYPLYSQKEYLEAAQRLPLTQEERELVFWKNAINLFKLPVKT